MSIFCPADECKLDHRGAGVQPYIASRLNRIADHQLRVVMVAGRAEFAHAVVNVCVMEVWVGAIIVCRAIPMILRGAPLCRSFDPHCCLCMQTYGMQWVAMGDLSYEALLRFFMKAHPAVRLLHTYRVRVVCCFDPQIVLSFLLPLRLFVSYTIAARLCQVCILTTSLSTPNNHSPRPHTPSATMVRLTTLLTTLILTSTAVLGQASNNDPHGKVLYVNYPSCDFYQCTVTWHQGESVYVNWLNAPKGGLRIQLAPQEGVEGLKTYTVTDNVGSIHGYKEHKCDNMGTGEKCGRFDWVVPKDVKEGKYQIEVTSLAKPELVGYTDTVLVKGPKKGTKGKRHELQRME